MSLSLRRRAKVLPMVLPKAEGFFVCGVCARSYAKKSEAASCLLSCSSKLLKLQPTLELRKDAEFGCQICKRSFSSSEEAISCAKQCFVSLDRKLRLCIDSELKGVPDSPLPKRRPPQLKVLTSKSSPLPIVEKIDPPKKVANPKEAPVDEGPPAAVDVPAQKETPKIAKDPKKQFIRDGAEYVCLICSSRFYTKMEVLACWDAH